jgi:hypothetical protein
METTTSFLAQIWGPTILAVSLGVFISRKYYIKIYTDLQKESLAVLLFGMIAVATGIVHIKFHNVWDTLPEFIISFLGWGLLVKGLLFLLAPKFVDKAGDFEAKSKLVPVAGILMLVVGIYLSWIGYF